jgi:hypothetical protein
MGQTHQGGDLMIVLVCGSRDWQDQEMIRQALATLPADSTVIAGGARGADGLGEQIARELGLKTRVFPADWNEYGKRAGYIRNIQMLDQSPDQVWAFWDGKSRGTAHTIREAKKRGIQVKLWPGDGQETLPGF